MSQLLTTKAVAQFLSMNEKMVCGLVFGKREKDETIVNWGYLFGVGCLSLAGRFFG